MVVIFRSIAKRGKANYKMGQIFKSPLTTKRSKGFYRAEELFFTKRRKSYYKTGPDVVKKTLSVYQSVTEFFIQSLLQYMK